MVNFEVGKKYLFFGQYELTVVKIDRMSDTFWCEYDYKGKKRSKALFISFHIPKLRTGTHKLIDDEKVEENKSI